MSDLVPTTPISPLRQRLIDDMNMRRFSHEGTVMSGRRSRIKDCFGRCAGRGCGHVFGL